MTIALSFHLASKIKFVYLFHDSDCVIHIWQTKHVFLLILACMSQLFERDQQSQTAVKVPTLTALLLIFIIKAV